jgi:hypothetical protein
MTGQDAFAQSTLGGVDVLQARYQGECSCHLTKSLSPLPDSFVRGELGFGSPVSWLSCEAPCGWIRDL